MIDAKMEPYGAAGEHRHPVPFPRRLSQSLRIRDDAHALRSDGHSKLVE